MAEAKAAEGAKRKVPKGRHLSTIKRHRQSLKRRERNFPLRASFRTAVKKLVEAVEKKDGAAAKDLLKNAMSELHRAAGKGIVKAGHASRHIARLSSMVARLG